MTLRMAALVIFATVGALASPAAAEEAMASKADCATLDTALPPSLSSWASRTALAAAAAPGDLAKATLRPGQAVTATLLPTRQVAYAVQPEKPGGSVSHGGLFRVDIAQAGTYQVVLGSGAWIDLLQDGKALESVAHGHGPDCSTARKVVDFVLQPGDYVLQVSANADPTLALLVTRKP